MGQFPLEGQKRVFTTMHGWGGDACGRELNLFKKLSHNSLNILVFYQL
jgi:hypothetical protein